jgi:hypothetical protein
MFLGAFAELRKATINFVMSVRPAAWNNSVHTVWIFVKFYIMSICRTSVKQIHVSLKLNKNNGCFK